MNSRFYDAMPDAKELGQWWLSLGSSQQKFFREHDLIIPFSYYGYPERFAAEALLNPEVRSHVASGHRGWSLERVHGAPEMRWQFEHVIAIGGFDVIRWSRSKNWGSVKWVSPILPDDPVDKFFLTCFHRPTSPYRQRKEQRDYLKARLGKGYAALVTKAMRLTQGRFLEFVAEDKRSQAIATRLQMSWVEFWQYARGVRAMPDMRQKRLFS